LITSVTTASVAATSGVAGWGIALGAGGAVFVIGLLIALELMGPGRDRFHSTLRSALRIAMAPLMIVFVVSIVTKALLILSA
jgi:hypothetical protein